MMRTQAVVNSQSQALKKLLKQREILNSLDGTNRKYEGEVTAGKQAG